jgi:hypothetical protein
MESIEEPSLKGTDAISMRKQMIVLGMVDYLPDSEDLIKFHRGWHLNVRILFCLLILSFRSFGP